VLKKEGCPHPQRRNKGNIRKHRGENFFANHQKTFFYKKMFLCAFSSKNKMVGGRNIR